MNHKRGTGRTTRMIEHAVSLVLAGDRVTVVMLNNQDQSCAALLARRVAAGAIRPASPDLRITTMQDMHGTDWVNLEVQSSSRVLLVDHAVIEYRFHRIITEWTRFDTQEAHTLIEGRAEQYTPSARRLRLGSKQ